MRMSYSQFSTYRRCPQQYQLQYVERVRVPVAPELHFGAAIHDALNHLYDPRHLERPTLEEVVEAFLRSWRGREQEVPEERRQSYFESGVELLRRHYEQHGQREKERRTAATELSFSVRFDGDHSLTGRIDRVDVLPGKRLEVVDYKTSRRMPPQAMVEKDAQLAIYRMAADALYPGFEVTTTLFYLLHDVQMRTVQSEEFLAETRDDILDAVVRIQLEEFDPNPGTHCEWCGVRDHCELFRRPVEPEGLEIDIGEALREYTEANEEEREARERKARAQTQINSYLDQCEAERAEAGGYVAERRRYKRVTSWDMARLREALEPLGLWERVTQVNSAAVKELLGSREVPGERKREIEAAAEYKETKQLRVKPAVEAEELEELGE